MENKMTWLDLYNILHKAANDISNLDSLMWQQEVCVYDAETGDELPCNLLDMTDDGIEFKKFIVINGEKIYE